MARTLRVVALTLALLAISLFFGSSRKDSRFKILDRVLAHFPPPPPPPPPPASFVRAVAAEHPPCSKTEGDRCYPLSPTEFPKQPQACPTACVKRYGHGGQAVDGSWWVCETPRVKSAECVVYLFGVGFDPSFDKEFAAARPNCQVHSFDPTPGKTAQLMTDLAANHHFHP